MQTLKLDINPKGEIPVLFAAQYDNGREFGIELVEGEEAYNVPSGYSVQLNVRKTDSKLVTKAPESIVDNIITFATTEQMTACPGENIASVTLKDADDYVITTLYFLISVQRDVLAGGLDSASEIHDLEQQIAAIVPEVIGDDYYNKTETDELLENKADKSELPDMTNYYTKTQTDNLLNDKADRTDLATLASKAEVTQAISDEDTALKNWAYTQFATPGYVATRYYNKTQVDTIIDNIFPTLSTLGAIASFTTALNKSLVGVTAEEGATTITLCGSNLFDEERLLNASEWSKSGDWYMGSVGQLYTIFGVNGAFWHSDNGVDSLRVSYTAYVDQANVNARAEFYYSDGTSSLAGVINGSTPTDYTAVSTSGKTVIAVKWGFSNDATLHIKDFSINYPSSKTAYEPYNGQTVPVADATTLTTLSGVNNVFADSGDVTVQYKYMSM